MPGLPEGLRWHVFANTGIAAPDDIATPGQEPLLADPQVLVGGRSVVILVGK
jgi:glycogen operon protein